MLKKLLGQEEEPQGPLDELKNCCNLSYTNVRAAGLAQVSMARVSRAGCVPCCAQRLYGFCICFAIGFVLSVMSTFFIPGIIRGDPGPFATTYTLGNLCAIGSSAFLMGPMRQLKSMMKETRIFAALIYVGSMALTLYFAFGLKSAGAVIVGIIVQFLAGIWYCLSYIPGARACVKASATSMC